MKHHQLFKLVKKSYQKSKQPFAKWMWQQHVPTVVVLANKLADKYGGNTNLAVAGALLHDFGDAFIDRFDKEFETVSQQEAKQLLIKVGYQPTEIINVLYNILKPHSCRGGNVPTTIEGKVVATADAITHLKSDFYLQFCWMHLPQDKSYQQWLEWIEEKLERDFHKKIFFEDERKETLARYLAMKNVFTQLEV